MKSKHVQRIRLVALLLLIVGLFVAGRLTGLHEQLDAERVRETMQAAGGWGFALYLGLFSAGELLHVPGLVFVAAAVLVYGKTLGTAAALFGAVFSVTVSFVVTRAIGGQPLSEVKRPFLKKMLAHLDRRPIRTVALLRLLLWMTPSLNYALAMSGLRFRDYFIGSVVGLVVPVTIASLIFGWVIH